MPLNYGDLQTLTLGHVDYPKIQRQWADLFEKELGPMPQRWMSYCCAQFVVEKTQILRHPKEFYQYCYKWLLDTPMDNWDSSRVFEHVWQLILGNPFEERLYNDRCDLIFCDKQ